MIGGITSYLEVVCEPELVVVADTDLLLELDEVEEVKAGQSLAFMQF